MTDFAPKIGITHHPLEMDTYPAYKWLLTDMAIKVINTPGSVLHMYSADGFIDKTAEQIIAKSGVAFEIKFNSDEANVYITEDKKTVLSFGNSSLVEDGRTEVMVASYDKAILDDIKNLLDKHITKSKRSVVYALTSNDAGMSLSPIGNITLPLSRDNYEQYVLDGFDFICEDLVAPVPYGRLVIINGNPGTGKTYLMRGLIEKLDKCMVVVMPFRYVQNMDGPEMISILTEHRRRKEGPIVIIIEDGDPCLVERMDNNMNAISALLNQTDGIMGSLMDIRIVITTNQDIQFDKALIRSGRLSRHIKVQELSDVKANEVYNRLTETEEVVNKYNSPTTLADVYAAARVFNDARDNVEESPGKELNKPEAKVGFV